MDALDRLHPALAYHVVNTLGWPRLLPLQEAALAPLADGEHALLLAPTAGGKTEAAAFPVLSRMLAEVEGVGKKARAQVQRVGLSATVAPLDAPVATDGQVG